LGKKKNWRSHSRGRGKNRQPDFGAIDEEVEGQEHHQSGGDHENRLDGHIHGRAEGQIFFQSGQARIREIKRIPPQALHQADKILQEKRSADGGNQRNQTGSPAQRTVGDALQSHRREPADDHPGKEHQEENESGVNRGQTSRGLKPQQDLHPDEGADDEDLAVSEINELQDAVHHGIAQGDERVHEAQDDPIDEHLEKYAEREIHLF